MNSELLSAKFSKAEIATYEKVLAEAMRLAMLSPFERMTEWKALHPRCTCTVGFLLNEDHHTLGCTEAT